MAEEQIHATGTVLCYLPTLALRDDLVLKLTRSMLLYHAPRRDAWLVQPERDLSCTDQCMLVYHSPTRCPVLLCARGLSGTNLVYAASTPKSNTRNRIPAGPRHPLAARACASLAKVRLPGPGFKLELRH
eukprot:501839-Rhodomonas_salina.2